MAKAKKEIAYRWKGPLLLRNGRICGAVIFGSAIIYVGNGRRPNERGALEVYPVGEEGLKRVIKQTWKQIDYYEELGLL